MTGFLSRPSASEGALSRRLFLAAGPAAAVFGALHATSALAGIPIAKADPVYAAIERHKAALDVFTAELRRQDDLSELTLADEAEYDRLDQAEADALMSVADTTPTTEIGAQTALDHLMRTGVGRHKDLFWSFASTLIIAKWRVAEVRQ